MSVNAVIVPIIDASPAVLANGNDDATGAAAAVPDSVTGALKRIISLITGTIFVTLPVTTGEIGAGAFQRGIGRGSERTKANKNVRLAISRYNDSATAAALTGSFAVYGYNLPDALMGKPLGNAYATAQTETVMVFKAPSTAVAVGATTTFDASALSTDAINADSKGYNWLVVVNGEVIPYSAAAIANNLSWSIASGVVTLAAGSSATAIPANADVVVYKIPSADVVQLLAAGTHPIEDVRVTSKTIVWTYWTTNQIATTRTIATLQHVTE